MMVWFFSTMYFTDFAKLNLIKIKNCGLVLGSNQFLPLSQLPHKLRLASKVVKK